MRERDPFILVHTPLLGQELTGAWKDEEEEEKDGSPSLLPPDKLTYFPFTRFLPSAEHSSPSQPLLYALGTTDDSGLWPTSSRHKNKVKHRCIPEPLHSLHYTHYLVLD